MNRIAIFSAALSIVILGGSDSLTFAYHPSPNLVGFAVSNSEAEQSPKELKKQLEDVKKIADDAKSSAEKSLQVTTQIKKSTDESKKILDDLKKANDDRTEREKAEAGRLAAEAAANLKKAEALKKEGDAISVQMKSYLEGLRDYAKSIVQRDKIKSANEKTTIEQNLDSFVESADVPTSAIGQLFNPLDESANRRPLTQKDATLIRKKAAELVDSIINKETGQPGGPQTTNAASNVALAANAGGGTTNVPSTSSSTQTALPADQEQVRKSLADLGAYDFFADSNKADLAKLLASISRIYFPPPDRKATKDEGFDAKTESEKIATVQNSLVENARSHVTAELKKSGKEANATKVFSPQVFDSEPYLKRFEEKATELVRSGGSFHSELPEIPGIPSESLRKSILEGLDTANKKYNEDKSKDIRAESKPKRAERLLADAKKILLKNAATQFESEEKIPLTTTRILERYCEEMAAPLTTGKDPVAVSDNIEDYKSSIYSKIRELYKELGGFGQILGVFGLKGYFAGIIADVLAERLDRVLTGEERAKIDEWAADLAGDLHNTQPNQGQQPVNVVRNPVQTPGYPQMPFGPMIPVMPHGKWSHGAKWSSHRPGAYLVPAGGYYVIPR